MTKQKKTPRSITCWVVVVRQNLDDTIAGSYATVSEARERMNECLASPGSPTATENMRTWDDSGLIAVAIYRVRGAKVEHYEQHEFNEDKKAA